MKTMTLSMPKLTSDNLLEAMGLERRRSASERVAVGLGLAALGAAFGAGAVLTRALMLGRERQSATLEDVTSLESVVA